MAIFTAYFDESGTPQDSKFLLVSGYIAPVREWLEFDRRWNQILASYGVKDFHMKDFAHSRGDFESWKGKEPKRKRFLGELINQICLHAKGSFSAALDLEGWKKANEKYPLDEPTFAFAPYALCGAMCVQVVEQWCERKHLSVDDVKFVFDDGAYQKGVLLERLSATFRLNPIFEKRGGIPGLQAADIAAYEYQKAAPQLAKGFFSEAPRVPFIKLNRKISSKSLLWRRKHVEQFAVVSGIPLREQS